MRAFLSRLFRRPRVDAPAWIEADELRRRLAADDVVVLVDVRQPEEFTAPPGHLPGAVNVPLADLPGRVGELVARRQPVVVVCKTDRRSARAATELRATGLRDVAVLRGGADGCQSQPDRTHSAPTYWLQERLRGPPSVSLLPHIGGIKRMPTKNGPGTGLGEQFHGAKSGSHSTCMGLFVSSGCFGLC
jgi:rhodanese-related sulfurtransferase